MKTYNTKYSGFLLIFLMATNFFSFFITYGVCKMRKYCFFIIYNANKNIRKSKRLHYIVL